MALADPAANAGVGRARLREPRAAVPAPGGYIRNAALRAAFLAVEEGTSLTHEHLGRAIRMVVREIGKLAGTGALE